MINGERIDEEDLVFVGSEEWLKQKKEMLLVFFEFLTWGLNRFLWSICHFYEKSIKAGTFC